MITDFKVRQHTQIMRNPFSNGSSLLHVKNIHLKHIPGNATVISASIIYEQELPCQRKSSLLKIEIKYCTIQYLSLIFFDTSKYCAFSGFYFFFSLRRLNIFYISDISFEIKKNNFYANHPILQKAKKIIVEFLQNAYN